MKPEPKWVTYSIIIGAVIMFSSIFIIPFVTFPWWVLQLLGALILFVPWIILWKPKKGQLDLQPNDLTYTLGDNVKHTVKYDKIEKIDFSVKSYDGQEDSKFGFLFSWWPYKSGYENIVTLFLNDHHIEFGVYAENKHQLKEIKRRFEMVNEKIKTLHNST